jgi:drug/metabolite transporter (DMT)-like permease
VAESAVLLSLFGVSLLWGCNYVVSAYLLHYFSPVFLSTFRICCTSLFLIAIAIKGHRLALPSRKEWWLLIAAGVSGTLLNQVFYFTGLHHSTAGNAALIISLSPIVTTVLSRIFLKEFLNGRKVAGAFMGLAGVVIIVFFGGKGFGMSIGDWYLLLAMLTLSISLLFIRKLSETMSAYAITIFATVIGSVMMIPAAFVERVQGNTVISGNGWDWLLLIAAGIVAQGLAGFWWNNGIAVTGAGTAAMFMNIPPFIALILAHFALGDAINMSQIFGGILVLSGVAIANRQSKKAVVTGTRSSAA